MSDDAARRPDFLRFHKSINAEMVAIRDRVAALIGHGPTIGMARETAFRAVLRRHLPDRFLLGSGFVVGDRFASTQIDVLVIDSQRPVLFRDGDLFIVTPDAVKAAVEVKSSVSPADLLGAAQKLNRVAHKCAERDRRISTGVFSFQRESQDDASLREALARGTQALGGDRIEAAAIGEDCFIRLWTAGHMRDGPPGSAFFYRSYSVDGLAVSYFLANLIHSIAKLGDGEGYAWFPLPGGKEMHATGDTACP